MGVGLGALFFAGTLADHGHTGWAATLPALFGTFLTVSMYGFGGPIVWARRIIVDQRGWLGGGRRGIVRRRLAHDRSSSKCRRRGTIPENISRHRGARRRL